jgi:hypothetical protein
MAQSIGPDWHNVFSLTKRVEQELHVAEFGHIEQRIRIRSNADFVAGKPRSPSEILQSPP